MKCKPLQILDSTPFSSQNQPFENLWIKEVNNKKWPNLAAKWNGAIFSNSNTNLCFQKFWNNNSHTPLSCHNLILHQIKPLTITHWHTFFLKPLHRIAQLANVKNPWNNNGYTSLHKAAPFGFFNKKSPKLIKIWKLFFKKHNKTNTKISGRLSQPWQLSRSGTPSLLLAQLKIINLQ